MKQLMEDYGPAILYAVAGSGILSVLWFLLEAVIGGGGALQG